MASTHPEPVAETWNHALETVRYTYPAAYDFLCFCAFLHYQNIPKEFLTRGATTLLPSLQRLARNSIEEDKAIVLLRTYSLLSRDGAAQTFSMNRMLQIVLQDKMSKEERLYWAKQAIQAVHSTVKTINEEDATPHHCLRYHQHVDACAYYTHRWNVTLPEASNLLHRMGKYLHHYARHTLNSASPSAAAIYIHIVRSLKSYAVVLRIMGYSEEANALTLYANNIQANIPMLFPKISGK
jgi:hypothetical protein